MDLSHRASTKTRVGTWQFLERQTVLGPLLVLPLLLVVIGLLAYPVASALLISLQDKVIGQPGRFIGLENYRALLFEDVRFRQVVGNSVLFTLVSVAAKLVVGMGMALILNQQFPFRGFFRGWLLLPWVTPIFVCALTARWMFDGSAGVINYVLQRLGIIELPIAWLGMGATAMAAVIITNIWRGFPFFGVTLLAAMQSIPGELYEAAEIDGANAWQRFWHITLPSLRTVLVIVTLLSTIWTFNDFTIVWMLTGGGPAFATHIFATYAYHVGFIGSRLGYAVAVSMVITPVLIALILLLSPLILRGEHE
jgi:ABC-type sugar transport system permease subunit